MAHHHAPVQVHLGKDHYASTVTARTHRLTADEPADLGGSDLGPTPYEYLGAALGSCTAITLRMYADRKGWPLEAIDVEVSHAKVHAEDCDCETTATGRIDLISRLITLHGDLDQEQRARLMEIADKCPVHRTLTGDIVVKTSELQAV